mmetsp:Transcript_9119/g.10571  ORF Transcript_9119/g.10571 Transcript_9119/m.10571 type:complete len:88 (-) Transcript_9119:373-636(-)
MLLEHVYSARPKDDKEDDKQTRGVLSFAASSAPYKCVILPLDQRIARDKRYLQMLDSLYCKSHFAAFACAVKSKAERSAMPTHSNHP